MEFIESITNREESSSSGWRRPRDSQSSSNTSDEQAPTKQTKYDLQSIDPKDLKPWSEMNDTTNEFLKKGGANSLTNERSKCIFCMLLIPSEFEATEETTEEENKLNSYPPMEAESLLEIKTMIKEGLKNNFEVACHQVSIFFNNFIAVPNNINGEYKQLPLVDPEFVKCHYEKHDTNPELMLLKSYRNIGRTIYQLENKHGVFKTKKKPRTRQRTRVSEEQQEEEDEGIYFDKDVSSHLQGWYKVQTEMHKRIKEDF